MSATRSRLPAATIPEPLQFTPSPLGRVFAALVVGALNALPRFIREGLARCVGALAYGLGIRRRVALDNLRHAFPEKSEQERRDIARGAYRNMALAALESLASKRILEQEPLGNMVLPKNWDQLKAALGRGEGVLMATAHVGSWELFGALLLKEGLPVHALVRPLKGALNERIMRARAEAGMRLIPPRGAVNEVCQRLAQGGLVGILTDQVISADKGVFVPFFGRPACTAPALALAAQRTSAPVYLIVNYREAGRLHCFIEGPIPTPRTGDSKADIVSHTAAIADAIERFVRSHPEQWLWLHRRWKVQPSQIDAKAQPQLEHGKGQDEGGRREVV